MYKYIHTCTLSVLYDDVHVCCNYIPSLGLVLGDLSGDSFEVTGAIFSTLTLSPWDKARGDEGSSDGHSSLGGKPQRNFCCNGGIPNSCSIITWRSVNVADGAKVRLAFFPSEEVTRILLLPLRAEGEGEGGGVLDVVLVVVAEGDPHLSVADICRNI